MNLRRIRLLTFPLALASCMDSHHGEPEIDVTAAFSAAPVSGTAPLVVQFTDESVGNVGGGEWDFGDGELLPFTTVPSPAHTYTAPGTYTVQLHVISCTSAVNCAHSFETKTDLITVTAASAASSSSIPGVPSEPVPSERFLAGPDAVAGTVAPAGTAPSTGADRSAVAPLAPTLPTSTGGAVLELVTWCTSGGSAHVCSIEGMDVSLLVGARTYSMHPAGFFPGTTGREESPCTARACYWLTLPGDVWPPSDACLLVRTSAGQELPRVPRRASGSEPAGLAAGFAFELIAHSEGTTTSVLRGTFNAPARAPRRP